MTRRVEICRRPFDVAAARAEVAAFEREYGVPSSRHCEPFTHHGVLHETDDWLRWDFLLALLDHCPPFEETRS